VVAITPFDGEEATAVALANDSEYGLSACVYTGSAAKGARVAARIKTGQVPHPARSVAVASLPLLLTLPPP
jgi:aldehyde dehydrogenase (NAD+)